MNVLVFGATGPTGSIVVEHALQQGHMVTGFTRRPASLQGRHQRLQPFRGHVLDAAAVRRAVDGQDVVISVYGVPFDPFHEISVYSEGALNIVEAMQHDGVPRYLRVTSGRTTPSARSGSSLFFELFITPSPSP